MKTDILVEDVMWPQVNLIDRRMTVQDALNTMQ